MPCAELRTPERSSGDENNEDTAQLLKDIQKVREELQQEEEATSNLAPPLALPAQQGSHHDPPCLLIPYIPLLCGMGCNVMISMMQSPANILLLCYHMWILQASSKITFTSRSQCFHGNLPEQCPECVLLRRWSAGGAWGSLS